MEYVEYKEQVRAGRLRPAYFLNRFNRAEADRALQLLEDAPRQPASDVTRESYEAPEQVPAALVSARCHPMWAEHKIIILAGVENLAAPSQRKAQEALVAYLHDPSPWATLVMISAKDSRSGSVPASLSRRAAVVNPPKVSSSSLAGWIRRLLAEAHLEMEPEAVALLLQVCKEDLAAVEQEMDKIVSAFAPGSVIGAQALEFLVEPRLEESIFGLLRALGEGRTGEALERMDQILRGGRPGRDSLLHLWYWFYRQSRELLGTAVVAAHRPSPEVLEALGVNPRALGALRQQLKNFSPSALRRMLQTLEIIDRQLKSSYTSQPRILLERYVVRLGRARAHKRSSRSVGPTVR